jgi:hypothetical protein
VDIFEASRCSKLVDAQSQYVFEASRCSKLDDVRNTIDLVRNSIRMVLTIASYGIDDCIVSMIASYRIDKCIVPLTAPMIVSYRIASHDCFHVISCIESKD